MQKIRCAIAAIILLIGIASIMGFASLLLDAILREQEFNDNVRLSRCERMDDHTRSYMKGYCK